MSQSPPNSESGKFQPLFILACLCFLVYSNTFTASWQFDDYPNILFNPAIHVDQAGAESFFEALFVPFGTNGRLRRPISNLTFALNWYFGGDDVIGYHLVNLIIHTFTGFILFSTIILLFRTPKLEAVCSDNRGVYFIALLSAIIWAIHPIQTQAVTYIVQRMASLAAFFYILGIFFYIKARLSKRFFFKSLLFVFCLLCYGLAIGSKENAITLPLALFLLEMVFFQDLSDPETRKRCAWGTGIVCVLIFVISLLVLHVFLKSGLSPLLRGYETRPFNLHERIMTQPRVLVFYLYQIFIPNPANFSLMHDFPVSTSLFTPWATMPAILCIFVMIAIAVYGIRRWPTFSFAILFYFLNHLVESTIIPLEMVYEHRNYLPSMFLFLPILIGLWKVLNKLRLFPSKRNITIVGLSLVIIFLGISTFSRNAIWATEVSLWTDTFKKAPGLARPAHNLGELYSKAGQYKKALELYNHALNAVDMRTEQKALTYYNMGNIFQRFGNMRQAEKLYRRAIDIKPRYGNAWYNLTLVLTQMGAWDDALNCINQVTAHYPNGKEYVILQGAILLKMKKIEPAMICFRNGLNSVALGGKASFYLGVSHHLSGNFLEADHFLVKSLNYSSDDPIRLLWLIKNRIWWKGPEAADEALQILFNKFTFSKIEHALESSGNLFLPDLSTSKKLRGLLENPP